MKYRKKPLVVEAITFEELVEYGRHSGAQIVNGMPWTFRYGGHGIFYENDQCYLVLTTKGPLKMSPGDILITGALGEIYPLDHEVFEANYEPAEMVGPAQLP